MAIRSSGDCGKPEIDAATQGASTFDDLSRTGASLMTDETLALLSPE